MGIWSQARTRFRGASVFATCSIVGALLLSACSSSPSANSHTSGANNSAAIAQVKSNWTAFFKGSTSGAKKVSVLQNGAQFASYIESQAKSSLGRSVSVKVKKVVVTSSTKAKVTYDILLNGTPQLTNASGTAVLQEGTWKVSDTSFCALLSLENAHVPACSG